MSLTRGNSSVQVHNRTPQQSSNKQFKQKLHQIFETKPRRPPILTTSDNVQKWTNNSVILVSSKPLQALDEHSVLQTHPKRTKKSKIETISPTHLSNTPKFDVISLNSAQGAIRKNGKPKASESKLRGERKTENDLHMLTQRLDPFDHRYKLFNESTVVHDFQISRLMNDIEVEPSENYSVSLNQCHIQQFNEILSTKSTQDYGAKPQKLSQIRKQVDTLLKDLKNETSTKPNSFYLNYDIDGKPADNTHISKSSSDLFTGSTSRRSSSSYRSVKKKSYVSQQTHRYSYSGARPETPNARESVHVQPKVEKTIEKLTTKTSEPMKSENASVIKTQILNSEETQSLFPELTNSVDKVELQIVYVNEDELGENEYANTDYVFEKNNDDIKIIKNTNNDVIEKNAIVDLVQKYCWDDDLSQSYENIAEVNHNTLLQSYNKTQSISSAEDSGAIISNSNQSLDKTVFIESYLKGLNFDDEDLNKRDSNQPFTKEEDIDTTSDRLKSSTEDVAEQSDFQSTEDQHKKTTDKLHLIIQELRLTELTYLENLERIIEKYLVYLQKYCPKPLREKLSYIDPIAELYRSGNIFLEDLLRSPDDPNKIAEVFIRFEKLFEAYPSYFRNKAKADSFLKDFDLIVAEYQKEFNDRLTLSSYLLTPVQRLGKYILLLENMCKEMTKLEEPTTKVMEAIRIVKAQMTRGNDLIAIESIEDCFFTIHELGSFIMRDTFNGVKPKKTEYVLFLFENAILLTYQSSKNLEMFQYVDCIKLSDLSSSSKHKEIELTDYRKHGKMFDSKYSYVLEAKTLKVTNKWSTALQEKLWEQLHDSKEKSRNRILEQDPYQQSLLSNTLKSNSSSKKKKKTKFYVTM